MASEWLKSGTWATQKIEQNFLGYTGTSINIIPLRNLSSQKLSDFPNIWPDLTVLNGHEVGKSFSKSKMESFQTSQKIVSEIIHRSVNFLHRHKIESISNQVNTKLTISDK